MMQDQILRRERKRERERELEKVFFLFVIVNTWRTQESCHFFLTGRSRNPRFSSSAALDPPLFLIKLSLSLSLSLSASTSFAALNLNKPSSFAHKSNLQSKSPRKGYDPGLAAEKGNSARPLPTTPPAPPLKEPSSSWYPTILSVSLSLPPLLPPSRRRLWSRDVTGGPDP